MPHGTFDPSDFRRRGLRLYVQADDALQKDIRAGGHSTTCSAGCAACCYVFISATFGEATIVADRVLSKRARTDVEALLLQLDEDRAILDSRLPDGGYLSLRRPCSFLTDVSASGSWSGRCSVYEDRPFVCRMHFVTSDPSYCAPDHSEHPTHRIGHSAAFREQIVGRITSNGDPFFAQIGPLSVFVAIALRWLRDGSPPSLLDLEYWRKRNDRWARADRERDHAALKLRQR